MRGAKITPQNSFQASKLWVPGEPRHSDNTHLDEVMACADTCTIPEWNCPRQLYPPYFPQSLRFLIPRKGMSCMGRRLVQSPKQLQSHGRDGDVSRQMSYGALLSAWGITGRTSTLPQPPPAVVQSPTRSPRLRPNGA